ncbi:3-methyl-adenine DNA glycosylase II [Aedoeadaptatus ivorii]|uniref:DNA-(apurinic or apyrimidinic site) lyase n=1 Tax=Aedoeadaptatus ivorii TaxID=54006 RepID=A0A3S4YLU4_9FIRM|nr:DNA-3-methyladenine glycosylase [Peptoniphilus ivorii]MDQ0508311.1 N-glycosylase/DNA lyase [Peptoniphilus ivorii]VEJ36285.1 3-methyl-adenine DNA glycosylase II [Peptoniphilus ivorii]
MNKALQSLLNSGQYFHWKEENGVVAMANGADAFFLTKEGLVGDRDRFRRFVDAGRNYGPIRRHILEAEDLRDLRAYLSLRILRQDPWEAIVAFILSANNHFGRIQNTVLALAETYGEQLAEYEGRAAFALPSPAATAALDPAHLRALGAGYRDRYLVETAEKVASGAFDINAPYDLSYAEAKAYLKTLSGVGPKVADCILLFGYGKLDAFPVDTWIAKAMARFGEFPSREAMCRYGVRRFGPYAGYVQQLLFVSEREKGRKP